MAGDLSTRFDRAADDHARRRAGEASFRLQVETVREHLPGAPALLLDLGAGSGALAEVLGDEAGRIVGCDLSERMLRHARSRGLLAVRADAVRLPYATGVFDAVVSLGLLEYVPDPHAMLREAARVLRPGGRFALSLPNPHAPARLSMRLFPRRFDQDVATRISPGRAAGLVRAAGLHVRVLRTANAALIPWPGDAVFPRLAAAIARSLRTLTARWPLAGLGTQTVVVAER